MTYKITNKQKLIFFVMTIIWIGYFIPTYNLFSEVTTFTTPGSSYIIKVLEFTNYRASNLVAILIAYFVLISITIIICMYIFIKSSESEKKSIKKILIIPVAILFIVTLFTTNIFSPIYLILTVLSFLIIIASFFVANTIWGKSITFEKGDIIYKSSSFESKEEADFNQNKLIKKIDNKKLQGEVFEVDNQFYFEIYALDKITLDSKGDFNIYENV